MKLVECVPNFSEGRDRKVLDEIGAAVESVEGVKLLDVDPGEATNRTVFTFVGPLERIVEAAFRAVMKAAELIDMSRHKGAHPRQGACDVCPFIPLGETTMEECVELSRELGRRVAEALQVPVYLYEYAATRPERKSLVDLRVGEYEGLQEKLKKPEWMPDFGPPRFDPKFGAMVTGARDFLIAYNINLNTRNTKIAKEIAREIRDKGKFIRDEAGKKVRGSDGAFLRQPGRFQHCKATGWYIAEYRCAQVTMNLTNFRVTPVHAVFDEVCRLAAERGVRVTGSEIVGLVPLEVLVAAGKHYLARQGAYQGVPESELVEAAIRSLGLNDVAPFDPRQKVIEYRLGGEGKKLMEMPVSAFCDETSSDSPAPGGGSVAALAGALSAALASMVAALTFEKKGYEGVRAEMDEVGVKAQQLKGFFARSVDEDTEAFNRLMAALRLPKGTAEERKAREGAILEATRGAIAVPEGVLEKSLEVAQLAGTVVRKGNENSLSDAAVAVLCARAAARGAYYNVLINLPQLSDRAVADRIRTAAESNLKAVERLCDELDGEVESKLRSRDPTRQVC